MATLLLTPEFQAAVLESVRRGTPARVALLANGVTDESIRRWKQIADGADIWPGSNGSVVQPETKKSIVQFVQALAAARAESLQVVTHNLWHNATVRNEKTGWYDTQALDKLGSKNPDHHDDWYERKQVQVDQQVTVNHAMQLASQLDDDALMQQYNALEQSALEGTHARDPAAEDGQGGRDGPMAGGVTT